MNSTEISLSLLWRRVVSTWPKKVQQHIIDIFDSTTYDWVIEWNTIAVCTLWVWEPSTVSRDDFIAIDKDAVLTFARSCKKQWVRHFLLLSSVWASAQSKSFFLRVKGELIDALKELQFEQLSIFMPSMIITPQNRYWFTQWLTLTIRPRIDRMFFWSRKKYRGVRIEKLWETIAQKIFLRKKGVFLYDRLTF